MQIADIIDIPPESRGELLRARTKHTKSFDMGTQSNGNLKRRTICTSAPLHFVDSRGNSREIDTEIIFNDGAFRSKSTPFNFSVRPDSIGFDYEFGGAVASFQLIEINDIPVGLLPLNIVPRINDNEIWFDEVLSGLDFYIKIEPDKVEIFKIVKNPTASRIFKWRIEETEGAKLFRVKIETEATDNLEKLPKNRPGKGQEQRQAEVSTTSTSTIEDGKRITLLREELTGRIAIRDFGTRINRWVEGELIHPVLIDADISETVPSTQNDGYIATGTTTFWTSYATPDPFGRYENYLLYHPGWRFTTIPIDPGVTIDLAVLKIDVTTANSVVGGKIYGNDVDDAGIWSSADAPTTMIKTTASTITGTVFGSTGVKTVPVTSIVQELVDRGGWIANNDMKFGLIATAFGTGLQVAEFYDRGQGATNATILEIDWSISIIPEPVKDIQNIMYIEQVTFTAPYQVNLIGGNDQRLSIFLKQKGLPGS